MRKLILWDAIAILHKFNTEAWEPKCWTQECNNCCLEFLFLFSPKPFAELTECFRQFKKKNNQTFWEETFFQNNIQPLLSTNADSKVCSYWLGNNSRIVLALANLTLASRNISLLGLCLNSFESLICTSTPVMFAVLLALMLCCRRSCRVQKLWLRYWTNHKLKVGYPFSLGSSKVSSGQGMKHLFLFSCNRGWFCFSKEVYPDYFPV